MNDAEAQQAQERTEALLRRYIPQLGLAAWRVECEWLREPFDGGEGWRSAAAASVDWVYLHALIKWCLPDLGQMDSDELEWLVLHELAHLLLNELGKRGGRATPAEEHVASVLAAAFRTVREAAIDETMGQMQLATRPTLGQLTQLQAVAPDANTVSGRIHFRTVRNPSHAEDCRCGDCYELVREEAS